MKTFLLIAGGVVAGYLAAKRGVTLPGLGGACCAACAGDAAHDDAGDAVAPEGDKVDGETLSLAEGAYVDLQTHLGADTPAGTIIRSGSMERATSSPSSLRMIRTGEVNGPSLVSR